MTRLLITGAGFSKAWGHPLTGELERGIKRVLEQEPEEEREGTSAQHIIDFLDALAKSTAPNKPRDFEELLSMLRKEGDNRGTDVWDRMGIPRSALAVRDPEYYYENLQWGLAAVLNWTGWGAPPDGWARASRGIPRAYARFMQELGPFDAIITLNYDTVPEYLVGERAVDYGIPDARVLDVIGFEEDSRRSPLDQVIYRVRTVPRQSRDDSVPILKLHGGLNLAYCSACRKAVLFPFQLPGYAPAEPLAWLRTAAYNCTVHCATPNYDSPASTAGRLRPLMIPPLDDKSTLPEWPYLAPVLDRVRTLADTATSVLIVGTSVRPSDTMLLDLLDRLRGKSVKFIGPEDAMPRLTARTGNATRLRGRLEVDAADVDILVPWKRAVDIRAATPLTMARPLNEPPRSVDEWRALPEFTLEGVYLVDKVAWYPIDAAQQKALGAPSVTPPPPVGITTLPSIRIERDGNSEWYRLPLGLSQWAWERVLYATAGHRDIPGRVLFERKDARLVGTVLGR